MLDQIGAEIFLLAYYFWRSLNNKNLQKFVGDAKTITENFRRQYGYHPQKNSATRRLSLKIFRRRQDYHSPSDSDKNFIQQIFKIKKETLRGLQP